MSLYGDLPSVKGGGSDLPEGLRSYTAPTPKKPPAEAASKPPASASAAPSAQPPSAPKDESQDTVMTPKPLRPAMAAVPRALRVQQQSLPVPRSVRQPAPTKPPATSATSLSPDASLQTQPRRDTSLEEQITDEYNPARPNDYEGYCLERERLRKQKEREREEKELRESLQIASESTSRSSGTKLDLSASADEMYARRMAMSQGQQAAPKLDLKASAEDMYARRMAMSQNMGAVSASPAPPTKRQRVQESSIPPSKLVLMRNMVGRGEVDADLRNEIAEECGKYGTVQKCVVHEMTAATVSDDEAIRIFVLFADLSAAMQAKKVMDGRFFGGRIVKAGFYDQNLFERDQLEAVV